MTGKQHSREEKRKLYQKLVGIGVLFLLICVIAIVAGRFVDGRKINSGSKEEKAESDTVMIGGVKCKPNWDIRTYLFIGEDSRGIKGEKTENDGTGQSDVLELLVIDTKNHTYYKLPINRDTITDVKSLDDDGTYLATTKIQIALAHANGDGMETSCENTVDAVSNMLYGIRIDGYMCLNIDSIKILNHLAGGVPVVIEDDFSQSDPSLKRGETVTLTDEQALHYVHDRMNVGDGTNECRMRRQKEYVGALTQIFKQKMKENSGFINTFYNSLSDYMVTDMSVGEMGNVSNLVLESKDQGEVSIEGTNAIGEYGYNEFTMNEDSRDAIARKLFFKEVGK
ncbi:MAG: LCP family protein [Eubacterium sp.]|nr:LCP family protein [Eubacterium sp.]MDY5496653.1 LCP family protein [Anaerobutyricum sp.]